MTEQKEILRRIAQRGLRQAQNGASDYPDRGSSCDAHRRYIDLWQRMLDEIQRLPEDAP